ncbi:hypothetical protein Vi05172_g4927 [Venturia inaequalis]|nr:hypothetical protein Vi05172_g4927 [Venturia inaequalis]
MLSTTIFPLIFMAFPCFVAANPSPYFPPDISMLTFRADTPANCSSVDFKTCPKGCMQYMQPRELFAYYIDCVCGCRTKIESCAGDKTCRDDRCDAEDHYCTKCGSTDCKA